ncbi:MAG: hypothetical protein WCE62_21725 [Polyangiales bacterium]
MKAFLVALALVFGCSDQGAGPPPGGGSGIPPILGTGNTGGSPPPDGGIEPGTDASVSRGACDNAADLGAIESSGSTRDISRGCSQTTCLVESFGDLAIYEQCVNGCVEDGVQGVSADCAACYGLLERCIIEQSCREACVGGDTCSTVCSNCLSTYGCTEEFESCRGLPGDGCSTPR